MSSDKTSKDKLKDIVSAFKENEAYRIVGAAVLCLVVGLFAGRCSSSDCVEKVVCEKYIKSRDLLEIQITNKDAAHVDDKKELAKKLRVEHDLKCSERINDAVKNCKFSERLHCPICVARGACKK